MARVNFVKNMEFRSFENLVIVSFPNSGYTFYFAQDDRLTKTRGAFFLVKTPRDTE